jgi:fatty-acid O-methyltransferase
MSIPTKKNPLQIIKRAVYWAVPKLKEDRAKSDRRAFYNSQSKELQGDAFPFFNWGYAPLPHEEKMPTQDYADQSTNFGCQMYLHLVSQVDLAGKRVLEVGCGRGGGSRFISENFKPVEMVGLDLSSENIKTCKRLAKDLKLTYLEGDAENLPFPDQSFDIVVNVESSHDYPNFIRFIDEVRRVLRKGGHFLFADYRTELGMLQVKAILNRDWRFGLVRHKDITLNVVEALRQNTPLAEESIRKHIKDTAQADFFRKWVRAEGSTGFNRFRDRLEVYASFVYRADGD